MTFQGLKMDYRRQCCEPDFRVENKHRLNLSAGACAVLQNDAHTFRLENQQAGGGGALSSALINHIFRCFRETARSSAALALNNRRLRLEELLAAVQPNGARQQAVQLLLEDYRTQLAAEIARRNEKGHAFSFRLDKSGIEYLVSDEGQQEAEFYNGNIGQYIKCVMEEYSEQPYVERERIFHKDVLDEMLIATANKAILRLTMHSTSTVDGVTRNNYMYLKPVGVRQDSERLYHYLVGITAPRREGPWNAGAIRLTAIKGCKCLAQPAFISREERKAVEDAIRSNGVQYLSASRTERIVVRLTQEGERLYRQLLHLRPPVAANPKPFVYEFECTPFQAETYFFKYGHNATILEPPALADKFLRRYQSAAKNYQKDR